MSLIHRIRLLLVLTMLVGLVAALAVGVQATRQALRDGAVLQNRAAARILAAELADVTADADAAARLLLGRFDSGAYRILRLVGPDGRVGFAREAATVSRAPDWFVRWSALEVPPVATSLPAAPGGTARIEVAGASGPLVDALWRSALELAGALVLISAFVGAVGYAATGPLRRQLHRAIDQAELLQSGRDIGPTESDVPEIRRLGRAMQAAAQRFRQAFEAHSVQLELMREEAHRDPATGLANRARYLQQLEGEMSRGMRSRVGGLVLLRLLDLDGLNRTIGHAAADRAIRAIAQTLQAYTRRVEGCFIGRLNGSDFALSLPASGVARETAEAVLELLRAALPAFGSGVGVVAGAVEVGEVSEIGYVSQTSELGGLRAAGGGDDVATFDEPRRVGRLLAAADAAMLRASLRGPFSVETADAEAGPSADVPS